MHFGTLHGMNIILKAFEGTQEDVMAERALQHLNIDTCISVLWSKDRMADIQAKEHIFVCARDLKAGRYTNIDWNTITPLDGKLIEDMRHCEAVFLYMIKRFSPEEIPYTERKRQYFDHLRYWNHMIETKKIDLLVCAHIPHQIYDIVIYDLCKLKGIPTLLMERCYLIDHFFMTESWEESAKELSSRIEELKHEYADETKPVPLSKRMEHYIRTQTEREPKPWFLFMAGEKTHLQKKNFIGKWSRLGLEMMKNKPLKLLSYIVRPSFWMRKLEEHKTRSMYDMHAHAEDLNKSYVYFALQVEPEMSLCPMSGAYADQHLSVQLLAAHLPKDTLIYIKEHPEQGEWFRSREYYRRLLDIPSVRLIPRTFSTFALMDNAKAVVTGTGSAGMEGLMRGIPVIMMGHRFYMYAPGVHHIHSSEDMRKAIDSIFTKQEKPLLRTTRIFLKAVEELAGSTMVGTPKGPYMTLEPQEQAIIMGEYIEQRIREVCPNV